MSRHGGGGGEGAASGSRWKNGPRLDRVLPAGAGRRRRPFGSSGWNARGVRATRPRGRRPRSPPAPRARPSIARDDAPRHPARPGRRAHGVGVRRRGIGPSRAPRVVHPERAPREHRRDVRDDDAERERARLGRRHHVRVLGDLVHRDPEWGRRGRGGGTGGKGHAKRSGRIDARVSSSARGAGQRQKKEERRFVFGQVAFSKTRDGSSPRRRESTRFASIPFDATAREPRSCLELAPLPLPPRRLVRSERVVRSQRRPPSARARSPRPRASRIARLGTADASPRRCRPRRSASRPPRPRPRRRRPLPPRSSSSA